MAFELKLSRALAKAGWKVKIRDKERLEAPHVTIIKKTSAWRLGLRTAAFLDDATWKDFPEELREAIDKNWAELHRAWDAMYPHNPVPAKEEKSDDDNG